MNKKLDSFIYYLLLTFLFVDSINGFMLNSGITLPITLSQFVKLFTVFLMIIRVASTSKFYTFLTILLLIVFEFAAFYCSLTYVRYSSFFNDIIASLKFYTPVLSFIYFLLIEDKELLKKRFVNIVKVNFIVLAVNLLLGLMGFGYSEYGGIGSSGFFFAGNEVSSVMLTLFPFILLDVWEKNRKRYPIWVLFMLVLAIIKVTKVAILGVLLISILIPYINERDRLYKLTKFKFKIILVLIILSPIMIFGIWYGIKSIGLLDRFETMFSRYDFITFIFSERNLKLETNWMMYLKEYSLLEYFFGKSRSLFLMSVKNYPTRAYAYGITEIDIFDTLFLQGFWGVIITFIMWLFLIFKSYKGIFNREQYYAPAIFVMNIMLFIVSFFAGHVMNSAMATFFFIMANGLYLKFKK